MAIGPDDIAKHLPSSVGWIEKQIDEKLSEGNYSATRDDKLGTIIVEVIIGMPTMQNNDVLQAVRERYKKAGWLDVAAEPRLMGWRLSKRNT